MAFHPDYVRLVLDPMFEDAKAMFLAPLMAIDRAHLVMLAEQQIIPRPEARRIRAALAGIDVQAIRAARYDGACEDLFFYLERKIAEGCGAETAGYLHTARSRNDIDMTIYRLLLRDWIMAVIDGQLALRDVLLELARRHSGDVFPAHTHTQPAQPTTLAHYLLAAVEQFERDTTRLVAAFTTVNQNPLGACAITGTGFPIDRARTAELLGFSGPTGNTYGSISAADYLLESSGAVAVALTGLGRFVQDMLFWSTVEIGYLRLPDGFVQTSSIMPQKRNPVALEHARALASRALGQCLALPLVVHNTPFGDIVDAEDDVQPLVAPAFRDATRAIFLVAETLRHATFNTDRMRERASQGWVTITELADTLARDHGLPFQTAHAIAADVASAGTDPSSLVDAVARAAEARCGRAIRLTAEQAARVLSPEEFVRIRRTHGGPAAEVVTAAIDAASSSLATDRARLVALRSSLAEAEARLQAALEGM